VKKKWKKKKKSNFSWSFDFLRESNEFNDVSSVVCEWIFSLFLRLFEDDEWSEIDEIDFDTGVLILDWLERLILSVVCSYQILTQQVENKAFRQH